MTQQWQLSGNAESVDWSDLAMAGRAYADNLVGEPAVSKVMHMMADEIERLRAVIRPESHAESDENRVLYDTKGPRNGAPSGCETVPDPDSRVWDTPCTPQTQATPTQGSVQGEGSVRDSRNANEPVAYGVEKQGYPPMFSLHTDWNWACRTAMEENGTIVPLYRQPQPTLTEAEREAVEYFASFQWTMVKPHAATLRSLLERLG